LKAKIAKHGLRNSLLVAPMPTASTSQILGYNECFEPFTSNMYSRRTLSGEYQIVNPYLLKDLVDMGIWDEAMKSNIIANNGSIQQLPNIPQEMKDLYKTVWELSQKTIIDMAADRQAFIDQSHSMNIHIMAPTMGKLTSMHFYGWSKGLKTGMYYLRTQAASAAIQFTIDAKVAEQAASSVSLLETLDRPSYIPHEFKQIENWEPTKEGKIVRWRASEDREADELKAAEESKKRFVRRIGSSTPVVEKPVEKETSPNDTLIEPSTSNENVKDEEEVDIFNSKVIACAIDNPESCTMCSG